MRLELDLPLLQSIELGCFALFGRDDDSSSLIMRSRRPREMSRMCRSACSGVHCFKGMQSLLSTGCDTGKWFLKVVFYLQISPI